MRNSQLGLGKSAPVTPRQSSQPIQSSVTIAIPNGSLNSSSEHSEKLNGTPNEGRLHVVIFQHLLSRGRKEGTKPGE